MTTPTPSPRLPLSIKEILDKTQLSEITLGRVIADDVVINTDSTFNSSEICGVNKGQVLIISQIIEETNNDTWYMVKLNESINGYINSRYFSKITPYDALYYLISIDWYQVVDDNTGMINNITATVLSSNNVLIEWKNNPCTYIDYVMISPSQYSIKRYNHINRIELGDLWPNTNYRCVIVEKRTVIMADFKTL